jgi:hypothetical protein
VKSSNSSRVNNDNIGQNANAIDQNHNVDLLT